MDDTKLSVRSPLSTVSLRIDFGATVQERLGPGKVALLEQVDRCHSISAAARALGMSYRRAWLLLDALNHLFKTPLVSTSIGGARGGGATLTPTGQGVVREYRAAESATLESARAHLKNLDAFLQKNAAPAPKAVRRRARRGVS